LIKKEVSGRLEGGQSLTRVKKEMLLPARRNKKKWGERGKTGSLGMITSRQRLFLRIEREVTIGRRGGCASEKI